jgi:hypothetical protein
MLRYQIHWMELAKWSMKIISSIEAVNVISKILKHLGLWEVKQRPPPRAKAPPRNIHIDYTASFLYPILWGWSLLRPGLFHINVCLIIEKWTRQFKGCVRPKLAKTSVIAVNLIGDHIYSPLFATIHNPFCHITFLKHHILWPIFYWHTRLIPLYLPYL